MATKKTTKKATTKKPVAKKAATKKTVKKAATKKATVKKEAVKKATTKKPVAKKKVVKKTVKKAAAKTVEFRLYSPASGQVEIAGDFNEWQPNKTPLKKDREGFWTVQLKLPAGKYQYKLVFDGEAWELDPSAPQVQGEYGPNNLLVVK